MALFKSYLSTPVRSVSPTPLDYATAQVSLRQSHLPWIAARQMAMDIVRENRPDRSELDAAVIEGFRFGESQVLTEADHD